MATEDVLIYERLEEIGETLEKILETLTELVTFVTKKTKENPDGI